MVDANILTNGRSLKTTTFAADKTLHEQSWVRSRVRVFKDISKPNGLLRLWTALDERSFKEYWRKNTILFGNFYN